MGEPGHSPTQGEIQPAPDDETKDATATELATSNSGREEPSPAPKAKGTVLSRSEIVGSLEMNEGPRVGRLGQKPKKNTLLMSA